MAYQITGNIELIGEITSKVSSNGGQPFQSRMFVLDATRFNPETGEPWENHPKFELNSRNVNMIDGFRTGQRVTVDFVVRGVKYFDKNTGETRYFTTINAIRITSADQRQYSPQSQSTSQKPDLQNSQQPQYAHTPQGQSVQFPPKVYNNDNPNQWESYDLPF